MKITKNQLRRLIKEELSNVLNLKEAKTHPFPTYPQPKGPGNVRGVHSRATGGRMKKVAGGSRASFFPDAHGGTHGFGSIQSIERYLDGLDAAREALINLPKEDLDLVGLTPEEAMEMDIEDIRFRIQQAINN